MKCYPGLRFVLVLDAIVLMFLVWTAKSSRVSYSAPHSCSSVELPLGLVSGMPELEFTMDAKAKWCRIDERKEVFGAPCQLTSYRCSSYCFRGLQYAVELEFWCGRLMSVSILSKDDEVIGIKPKQEMLAVRRQGEWVRYSDVSMTDEVNRHWMYNL